MAKQRSRKAPSLGSCVALVDALLHELAGTITRSDLASLMEALARDLGFRHYALVHHDDLRQEPPGRVNLKNYPPAVTDRIVGQGMWRRDPVMRGCIFADGAFLWSDLPRFINIDRRDREMLAFGANEGLNEGITVPCPMLGQCLGSCTFAGLHEPDRAGHLVGLVQVLSIFAFQAAKRIVGAQPLPARCPQLHPGRVTA